METGRPILRYHRIWSMTPFEEDRKFSDLRCLHTRARVNVTAKTVSADSLKERSSISPTVFLNQYLYMISCLQMIGSIVEEKPLCLHMPASSETHETVDKCHRRLYFTFCFKLSASRDPTTTAIDQYSPRYSCFRYFTSLRNFKNWFDPRINVGGHNCPRSEPVFWLCKHVYQMINGHCCCTGKSIQSPFGQTIFNSQLI